MNRAHFGRIIRCLIFVLALSRPIVSCPNECSCSNGQVTCRRLPASKLIQLPKNTESLTLQNTDLRQLERIQFASLLSTNVKSGLQRIELLNNDIVRLSSTTFEGLPSVRNIRIGRNAVNCDCNILDLIKSLESNHIRVNIICSSPPQLSGRNVNHITKKDVHCGDGTHNLVPATRFVEKRNHHDTMFVCRSEDELNLDEFETDLEYEDGDFEIKNVAASLIGEHDCVFSNAPPEFDRQNVKLMVTTEANAYNGDSADSTEFKAELMIDHSVISYTQFDDDVTINCPKSGTFICKGEKHSKPTFTSEPFDMEAYEGTTIELPCEGTGYPKPVVSWSKNGIEIELNSNYRIAASGSLFIKKVIRQDAGRYECSLQNEHGRVGAIMVLKVKNKETAPNEQVIRIAFSDASHEVDTAINQTMAYLFDPNSKRHHGDLFKIARYPRGDARQLARASEIYERTLVNLRKRIDDGATLKVDANDFNYTDILSAEHLDLIAQLSGCMAHRITPNCSANMCFHLKYRSADGTCNNLEHAMWGASLTGFRRLATPIYENGFSTPVGWEKERLYFGHPKPSARLVSTEIISTKEITQDDKITHMVMQWGQFLDHDLDHAIPSVSSESWDGIDCKKTCENTAPCYPIQVPPNDERVTNRRCIDLFRSSAICGSGMTSILFGTVQHREQINQLTAYIDASQVYGYSYEFARDLRDVNPNVGLLRTGIQVTNQKALLPFASPTDGIDCRKDHLEETKLNCFTAGDIRVNEQIGLTAMHTIWLREHNRIATDLKRINFHWDGETLYQEARKIVGAQMQLITYEHWLPIILGPEGMQMLGPYTGYDPTVEASISNEFATAALRFGHTLINPILHRLNETFQPIKQGHLELHRAFFAPWLIPYEGGVDPLMRGMFSVPAKLKKPTQNLNTELTEKLFFNAHAVALDLAAINIQRGRDHGIPGYNEYRAKCNMTVAKTFDDLKHEITDANVRAQLKHLYGHPSNIDLFVGGILEDQVEGGKIGPLFRCILIDQFDRLRKGDRHWYENPSTFQPAQLTQIKMASLGRVLCDNGDNITQVTDNVFFLPKTQGGYKSCDQIPKINLNVWLNCDKCAAHQDPNTLSFDPTLPRPSEAATRTRRDIHSVEKYMKTLNDLQTTINELNSRIAKLEGLN